MQGPGTMRPIAAATRSGSTLLAGPTRTREPERVWGWPVGYGLAAEICPQARLRCASLGAKSTYQIVVMRATRHERLRKPLLLRQLLGPSLRNHSDGPSSCGQVFMGLADWGAPLRHPPARRHNERAAADRIIEERRQTSVSLGVSRDKVPGSTVAPMIGAELERTSGNM